jgi:hypothetical protein
MMDAVSTTIVAGGQASIKRRGQYKYIDFYINLLNLTKPFNSSLKK